MLQYLDEPEEKLTLPDQVDVSLDFKKKLHKKKLVGKNFSAQDLQEVKNSVFPDDEFFFPGATVGPWDN